ncbi:TIGR01244 family sulfur transferase [Jiella avicenniae]|uniref:TIGR01244 family phosphatase n=1 Tax=Jiella avicenniae TaxID=2907202 RepID=A0A9X1P6I5_9HYPH|nr:TIGR01244 family sulfur transferase [Jiella avicenniae]MCE7030183.1 TIGR01244 family phosphatase [Jiella avicenniae]
MDPKNLTEQLAVRDQVSPDEVAALGGAGFRSIIVNRPDGEGADQPSFAEIERAARDAGMEARYIPVVIGKTSNEDVAKFAAAMDELPKPVVAFCRSGMRSATLWALSQVGQRPEQDIVARAKAAGYDVAAVTSRASRDGSSTT